MYRASCRALVRLYGRDDTLTPRAQKPDAGSKKTLHIEKIEEDCFGEFGAGIASFHRFTEAAGFREDQLLSPILSRNCREEAFQEARFRHVLASRER
jgi:hypothetical protein